ncbi:hypothetical protein CWI38_2296p0010, partial [Hamiltosporidium tvaerminnensis]
MTNEITKFINNIGLEKNKTNSAPNVQCGGDTATLLERIGVYKHLGIIENSRSVSTSKKFKCVQIKLIAQVQRLCRTRLTTRNLFQAIYQHAISLLNYHKGLDNAVRVVLVKNKKHIRLRYKERLCLPHKELEEKNMLLQLLDCLEKHKDTSTRRAAILKVENNNKTHLSLIKNFLKIKYGLEEEVTKKKSEEAQLANLYNEIKNRKLHSKLYSARNNELVSVNDSSRWLKKGSVRPLDEAVFCYIQDRNVFWGAEGMCQHCNQSRKTVDHLATRCEKMLGHDYTRRHNEVVRCIHL